MNSSNLVWRLMRRNISVWQIAGYAIANLVGLAIVLTALQFYSDATGLTDDSGDQFVMNRDYLVVSKKVDATHLISGNASFTDSEIKDLESQPWVENMAEFTPARFRVQAYLTLQGHTMSTDLFFESVPDEYFDVKPEGWDAEVDSDSYVIPIIIPKDYLALYNFGFAASRGMPQISERVISSLPLAIRLGSWGNQLTMPARIVGFSSRLNTVAVPDRFMQWANGRFGRQEDGDEGVSRLIVEVNDPGNPEISKYLSDNSIEVAGDKMKSGQATFILRVVTAVVISIGAVICLLAFFILTLSIWLLLQKNREKIHDLLMLGYTASQAARPYYRLVATVNLSILLLAVGVMFVARQFWLSSLEQMGLTASGSLLPIVAGIVVMAAITILNLLSIRRIVRKNF